MPNNYVLFFEKGVSSYTERLEKVERLVLNYNNGQWTEWLNRTWFSKSHIAGVEINLSQKILERLADYLLTGNFDTAEIITLNRMEKIRQKEIPISSASPSVANFVYGDEAESGNDDFTIVDVSTKLTTDEVEKNVYDMNTADFERRDKKDKSNRKTWRKSKTFRMNKFRSTEAIETYRVKPVMTTDKEGKRKTLKTLDGVVVLDAVYITIGGKKGIIDEMYLARWCTVDAENVFEFMGDKYRISDNIEQYAVDFDNDNKATMEKILCYYLPQSGRYLFYDENINDIEATFIIKI
jgi:hypothetical protein